MQWNIEQMKSANAHRIKVQAENLRKPQKFRMLLVSDEHWDNAHCDLDLLRKHHEEAKNINAPILKFGDTFCAMQGKWDRRADQNELRPEHRGNNYLDRLLDTAADWYEPYKKQIALVGQGNHEVSVEQRHHTNLVDRFAGELRRRGGVALSTGIWGYVRVSFEVAGQIKHSNDIFFHHGYGGGGEVTRGMIDNSRTRGQHFADVYYSGHIHRRNMDENVIDRLNIGGVIESTNQIFLRGGSYKSEGVSGCDWHSMTGKAKRPSGGWWVDFELRKDISNKFSVTIAEQRAV
jgi:hypothetical protein